MNLHPKSLYWLDVYWCGLGVNESLYYLTVLSQMSVDQWFLQFSQLATEDGIWNFEHALHPLQQSIWFWCPYHGQIFASVVCAPPCHWYLVLTSPRIAPIKQISWWGVSSALGCNSIVEEQPSQSWNHFWNLHGPSMEPFLIFLRPWLSICIALSSRPLLARWYGAVFQWWIPFSDKNCLIIHYSQSNFHYPWQ